MAFTRRQFMRSAFGLAGSGLAVPGGLWSPRAHAGATSERYILFVLANGGWDPTYVFAPKRDSAYIDSDDDGEAAEENGIPFLDSGERPAVREFFESYGDRAAVINGLEVRSISHDRCRRILMTGSTSTDIDDWGAILASTHRDQMLPYLVARGPSYSSRYTDLVIRLGESGQFEDLLTGEAIKEASDMNVILPQSNVADLTEAFLEARLRAYSEDTPRGRRAAVAAGYQGSLERLRSVDAVKDSINLNISATNGQWVGLYDQANPLLSVFEQGLGRAAIVQHDGLWNDGWDTHANNSKQTDHYEDLFANLTLILDSAAAKFVPGGERLLDVLTIAVISEMGRAPTLNSTGGKDHWTFTSAMLIGAGVQGGQVIGDFDDTMVGKPVDLDSGAPHGSGELLTASHLGATILTLGGIDPGDYLTGVDPIRAALR